MKAGTSWVLALPLLWACTGEIDSTSRRAPPGAAGANTGGSSGSGGSGASSGSAGRPVVIDDVTGVDPETLPDGVPGSSRVLRLSYEDYDRTLSDLLGFEIDASANFPEEQPNLGPYEGHSDHLVNERLFNEITRTAEAAAEELVASQAAYASVVGCDPAASACRDGFIDSFGLRALRRPLTSSEQLRYRRLFDAAGALYQSGDAFRDGVRLVVEAMLQSPKFLYRIESGSPAADDHGVLLSAHEVASRLSYMFWGTLPDSALLAAAASGVLATAAGVAEQARRLVADPRFTARALDFHARWMQLDELNSLAKDPDMYPAFSPRLVDSMRAETRRFIEEVTLTRGGTIVALLTAPFGYADSALAEVYGLGGAFGAGLSRVDHAPDSGRIGLFTQASFLAGHSSNSTGTSPILRGVFLLRRVGCFDILDPPPGAQMQEPEQPPAEELLTTRQYFTWKTSMAGCAACHTQINPTGFAFEQFDGIGQWRTTENGAPIDATGTLGVGADRLTFDGAKALLEGLAAQERVRACYAKNWLQYAYGRRETDLDLRAIGLASRDMSNAAFSIRDLAVSVTARPSFTHLPPIVE